MTYDPLNSASSLYISMIFPQDTVTSCLWQVIPVPQVVS